MKRRHGERQITPHLIRSLRRRARGATVADLVADTGLPSHAVGRTLNDMLGEYRGHMKVTESGEVLYYFPDGFRSTRTGLLPALKRAGRTALRGTGIVLAALFKVWIVAMLVGYFALFVLLLLAAMFASVAATAAARGDGRSRSRGGGFGAFYLTTRLFQLATYLWLYSSAGKRRPAGGRPLHRSVFAYVFGDADPDAGWREDAVKTVIAQIRHNKGVITETETMATTGCSPAEAEELLHRLLIEQEGEPSVSEEGTLYCAFPKLMATGDAAPAGPPRSAKVRRLRPFNQNPRRTNGWITFFNGFNLLFGGYFLYGSLTADIMAAGGFGFLYAVVYGLAANVGNPWMLLFLGLGVVPVAFSVLFYLTPLVRRLREKRENEDRRRHNLRRKVLERIFRQPLSVDPVMIMPTGSDESPKGWKTFVEKTLKAVGSATGVDVLPTDDGMYRYSFPEVARQSEDMQVVRAGIDPARYAVGKVIFDSRTGDTETSAE